MIALLAAAALALPSECSRLGPLYWEIGDANGVLASGSEGRGVDRDKVMPIASATKWLFGAFVFELRQGTLTDEDKRDLRMLSGYTQMRPVSCIFASTVGSCMSKSGGHDPKTDGEFHYNGGHFQHWAASNGFADDSAAQFGKKMQDLLGVPFEMRTPSPSGGGAMSAAQYATFLRRLMKGDYKLSASLGKDSVSADYGWRYSYAHWVEDDGALSSPGLFGFYPWIDGQTYGIVARHAFTGAAYIDSAKCGRALRQAFAK
jgi:hypothetical protein